MSPEISKFLIEGGEVLNTNNKHLDNLMQYLDDNLCTLSNELNEENFPRILAIIVDQVANVMFNLIQSNLEVSSPSGQRTLLGGGQLNELNDDNCILFPRIFVYRKRETPRILGT